MRRRHPSSPSPAIVLALSFLWALLIGCSGGSAEIYLPKLISSSSGATLPLKRFDKVRVKTLASEKDRSKIFQLSAHALARDGKRTCSSCRYLDTVLEGYDDVFTVLELGVGNCEFLRGLVGRGVRARGLDVFPTLVETYCSDLTLNGTVFSSSWSLGETPFPQNSFDLVVSVDTLNYVPLSDVPMALKTMRTIARQALVVLPTASSKKKQAMLQRTSITAQSRAWWARKFAQAGLQIDKRAETRIKALKHHDWKSLRNVFPLKRQIEMKASDFEFGNRRRMSRRMVH